MKIGFIGLGNMGTGMAANLLENCRQQGDQLLVLDLNHRTVADFVGRGAIDGVNAKNMAAVCDVLFTSLPSSNEINKLAFGEEGILKNARMDSVWFETSTNKLSDWEKVRMAAPEHLTLIDAPVTGGAEGAAAGTLTMLLGIEEGMLKCFQPLLTSFTRKTVRMGPPGAGYVSKLVQLHLNYLVAQGIGEALMLGASADLDLGVLHEVLQNSCAQSYVVDSYIPKVLDGSYDPSFALGLAEKDMGLITELGDHLGVELALADKVHQTYRVATEKYGFDEPHLSVIRLIEEHADKLLRA